MTSARKTAVDILCSVESDSAYSNITVNKYLKDSDLSPCDKALVSNLVYGVLDRKITLDYIISSFITSKISKLKPVTLNSLRIAVYQIKYLEKIPDSAAVNESVNIVKASKERYNSSFVNGVLRSFLRKGCEIPDDDSITSLSVKYSCPAALIESYINDYGLSAAKGILDFSLLAPPVFLRVNNCKTDLKELQILLLNEGIETCEERENCLKVISGEDKLFVGNAFKEGLFHVQDTASQISVEKAELKPKTRILDMCSAPGGKAFTAAEIIGDDGEIIACDKYEKRTELINKGAKRLGLNSIKCKTADATVYNKDFGIFDSVLCDVPCSGLGVIRRKPEIKYKSFEKFKGLEEIQLKILSNADNYLKKGGRLFYSTCTLRNAENEGILNSFLDKYPHYELKYHHTYLPHIDKTDGFFCALLIKSR